jgi:hypothetical protein
MPGGVEIDRPARRQGVDPRPSPRMTRESRYHGRSVLHTEFEWDEQKRLINIEKHTIDFLDVDRLFEGPHLLGLAKIVKGEQRTWRLGC